MKKNGLSILPIGIEESHNVDRWEETNNFGTKTKQSVFTTVITKYLLLHESGESIELAGYGHGVDAQDKGAGKSTTYALKNALLYTFLVPTGKIEDTDTSHSEEIEIPQKAKKALPTMTAEQETKAIAWLKDGGDINEMAKKYTFNKVELLKKVNA